MNIRPMIGVTGPDRGGRAAWLFTRLALFMAGGRAKRITPQRRCSVAELDGLVLGGGADIDPMLYGEENLPASREEPQTDKSFWRAVLDRIASPLLFVLRYVFSSKRHHYQDTDRDELEKELIAGAIAHGLPILGICRGAQLLNIWFGGSLHQNIQEFYEEIPQVTTSFPRKTIHIESESRLAAIMQKTTSRVNALHHQAINKLGENMTIAAREESTIIQAIENRTYPFLIGVQWHPEYILQHESQRRIFRALVKAAAVRRQQGRGNQSGEHHYNTGST